MEAGPACDAGPAWCHAGRRPAQCGPIWAAGWAATRSERSQASAARALTATTTTIANPIGWKNGRMAMLEIIQGTSTTVAWGAMFINVSGLTLNSTAGYSNVLIFKCVQVSGQPKVMLVSNSSSTRA